MAEVMARRLAGIALLGSLFLTLIYDKDCRVSIIEIARERRISFNQGWGFYKGEAEGAANPSFDDSYWADVRFRTTVPF